MTEGLTGVLPGLVLWLVRRVDLSGRVLSGGSHFDGDRARLAFDAECLSLGGGDGAAVYLLRDGVTVDQVVARVIECDDDEVDEEDDDDGRGRGYGDRDDG